MSTDAITIADMSIKSFLIVLYSFAGLFVAMWAFFHLLAWIDDRQKRNGAMRGGPATLSDQAIQEQAAIIPTIAWDNVCITIERRNQLEHRPTLKDGIELVCTGGPALGYNRIWVYTIGSSTIKWYGEGKI